MALFTERWRPSESVPLCPPPPTGPFGAAWIPAALDPEELVDTYVDEPPVECRPIPRRSHASLMTLLDPVEVGPELSARWTVPAAAIALPTFSLFVLEGGVDEDTWIAEPRLTGTMRRLAHRKRAAAYAVLACVSMLGLAELALFAAG